MKIYKQITEILIDNAVIYHYNDLHISIDECVNTFKTLKSPIDLTNYLIEHNYPIHWYCWKNFKNNLIKKIIFYTYNGNTVTCKVDKEYNIQINTIYKPYNASIKELSEYHDSTLAIQYIKQEYNKTPFEIITEVN